MMFTGMPRRHSIKHRIQGDLIHNFCLLGVVALASRYLLAVYWPDNPNMAPRPTKDCPNYEWVRDGYDGLLGFETPNLPGHSCTFRSGSSTGHLAWAVPLYQATYFVPGTFLHAFLMFAPIVAKAEYWSELIVGATFFGTGPALAAYLTDSLNEQASVWCFYSMYQCLFAFIALLLEKEEPVRPVLAHKGDLGETPLEFQWADPATTANGQHANGHANGKKVD